MEETYANATRIAAGSFPDLERMIVKTPRTSRSSFVATEFSQPPDDAGSEPTCDAQA